MQARIPRLFVPAVIGAACLAFASVQTDYDHHADFGRYHTYSWLGVHAGNSLWQDRIKAAVDNELAGKGWTRVASGGDASVAAVGRVTERDNLQTFYDGFPGWGWMGWGGRGTATTQVTPEAIGNLTVDVFDSGTKKLLWRGTSTDVMSSKPEKNDKQLDHAVAEMFDHFPPKGKG